MAFLLGTELVTVEMPTKTVFSDLSLGVDDGDHIGIVGTNGDGKSTLLRVLAGALEPDGGRVIRTGGVRVGFLKQSDELDDDATVAWSVVGDRPEYEWAADPSVRDVLCGLIGDIPWDARVGELSGGQRRRVDLARVLVGDWDVVMLDEPTNHLDMRTITWLAGHLKKRGQKGNGALLVVSHDRWFLDEVCNTMWEVHGGKVHQFEGGFSAYIMQRVERDRLAARAEQKRQSKLRRELAWLSRGARARATKPKFHVALARELIADVPELRNKPELKRMAMSRIGKDVVELQNVSVSYDAAPYVISSEPEGNSTHVVSSEPEGDNAHVISSEPEGRVEKSRQVSKDFSTTPLRGSGRNDVKVEVLKNIDWIIGPGDRIGIVGGNGAGKTTLLNVVRGALSPTSGRVKIGQTVKCTMLSQRLEGLKAVEKDRVREVVSRYSHRKMADGYELTPSQLLEDLGFGKADLNERVGDLSGGQKRRLALMMILLEESNVLILDEPGNDLDVDMLAALEDVLDGWPGTLLLVTHDRNLMERVTDDQFAIIDGHLRHLPGGIDEYISLVDTNGNEGPFAHVISSERSESRNLTQKQSDFSTALLRDSGRNDVGGYASDQGRNDGKGASVTSQPLPNKERQRLKKLVASNEKKIATAEGKLEEAQAKLEACDPSDYEALVSCQDEIAQLKARIEELELEWLEAQETLGE